jgi:hypothetical protein
MNKNFYKTKEWLKIKKLDRAQLLLVLENLKRGTIIYRTKNIENLFNKTKISYQTYSGVKRGSLLIARQKYLDKFNKDSRSHEMNGWILSYPACCTAEYARKRTPTEKKHQLTDTHHKSYTFGKQIEKTKKIPEHLFYLVPSLTPCKIDCKKTKKLLTYWMKRLKRLDPEAAKALKQFNEKSLKTNISNSKP